MSEPIHHHYLPVFYLKQWARFDGRIVRYHRPHRSVVCSAIAPSHTAYEPHLYALDGYPAADRQRIEKEYMGRLVDEPASRAIQVLHERNRSKLTPDLRSAWTRFAMSLRLRNPDTVKEIQKDARAELSRQLQKQPEEYAAVKRDSDPATLLEWAEQNATFLLENMGKLMLPTLIDNEKIGQAIFEMDWWVIDFSSGAVSLVTSDRPFVMTTPLKEERCVIALPIGPRHAFFAARHARLITRTLEKKGITGLAKALNESIVVQAARHVYGQDESHMRFVERRLETIDGVQTTDSTSSD